MCGTSVYICDVGFPSVQPAAIGTCGAYYAGLQDVATFQHVDVLAMMNVLFKDVGLIGLFTVFPATVSAYTNCILDQDYIGPVLLQQ